MDVKTNLMRTLERAKIPYQVHYYADKTDLHGGENIAEYLQLNPARVFKTLVTISKNKKNYVFVIPVNMELDLKKAAASVGEKSVEMIKSSDLLVTTGYVHGGCSPFCMKKEFKTVVDSSALNDEKMCISGGKIGYMIELKVEDLLKIGKFLTAEITREPSY